MFVFRVNFLFFGQSESSESYFGEHPKLRKSDQSELIIFFAFSSEWSDFCNFGYSPKYESDDSDWPKNQKIYSEHERIRLTKNIFGRLNIHENTKIQKSVFQYKGRRSRVSQVKSRVEISTFFPTNSYTWSIKGRNYFSAVE